MPVPADWKPLHQEISTLNYQLRLNVNTPVDDEKLTAALEDGVLTYSRWEQPRTNQTTEVTLEGRR